MNKILQDSSLWLLLVTLFPGNPAATTANVDGDLHASRHVQHPVRDPRQQVGTADPDPSIRIPIGTIYPDIYLSPNAHSVPSL